MCFLNNMKSCDNSSLKLSQFTKKCSRLLRFLKNLVQNGQFRCHFWSRSIFLLDILWLAIIYKLMQHFKQTFTNKPLLLMKLQQQNFTAVSSSKQRTCFPVRFHPSSLVIWCYYALFFCSIAPFSGRVTRTFSSWPSVATEVLLFWVLEVPPCQTVFSDNKWRMLIA